MPRKRPDADRVTFAATPDDHALMTVLSGLTGVRSKADISRAALRAHYAAITGKPWMGVQVLAPKTGTDG